MKPLITCGVHTYSAGMTLTYQQFKEIRDACYKTECIIKNSNPWKKTTRLYCYAYLEQGVKVFLSGKSGKLYRLRIQIEPCRVLGLEDPTVLFQPNKRQYKEMVKAVDKMLKKLVIPASIDSMKISRCDLTLNSAFSSQSELREYLRIFQKSLVIPHYKHVFFKKNDQKVKDYKAANAHSHCISCKSANFLIYDKIAQVEMIDRYDETLLNKHILRFEAELKRETLKKHLGKTALGTNWGLLSAAAKQSSKIVRWYLKRLQPECDSYLRYGDAVKLIEATDLKKKTEERMLYLLRKASDKESLTAALESMRKEFDFSKSQCNNVLKKFRNLGISPITLPNSSNFDELRPLI
ncbi:MAG: hypothetical protein HFF73_14805 [Oscillospiraceae bacterium]|nr:hypothetical protein [Oscillospiraceae bacterium]